MIYMEPREDSGGEAEEAILWGSSRSNFIALLGNVWVVFYKHDPFQCHGVVKETGRDSGFWRG